MAHVPGYSSVDLGPAWFWEQHTRVRSLASELGLATFEQPTAGDVVVEAGAEGAVRRVSATLDTSRPSRIVGGVHAMTAALADRAGRSAIRLEAECQWIESDEHAVVAHLRNGEQVRSRVYVVAAPPALAMRRLAFHPSLSDAHASYLAQMPTWMSWSMKVGLVYSRPTWREEGLSGEGMSQVGPAAQFYDATEPGQDAPGALVGWVEPHRVRGLDDEAVCAAVAAQASRMFGCGEPIASATRNWSSDPWTTSPDDPPPGLNLETSESQALRAGIWDDRLFFAASELARHAPGYLEGALARADEVAEQVASVLA